MQSLGTARIKLKLKQNRVERPPDNCSGGNLGAPRSQNGKAAPLYAQGGKQLPESITELEINLLLPQMQFIEGIDAKLTAIQSQWQRMQEGFESRPSDAIIYNVHKFPGSGAVYGLTSISEAARKFERILMEFRESGAPPSCH